MLVVVAVTVVDAAAAVVAASALVRRHDLDRLMPVACCFGLVLLQQTAQSARKV